MLVLIWCELHLFYIIILVCKPLLVNHKKIAKLYVRGSFVIDFLSIQAFGGTGSKSNSKLKWWKRKEKDKKWQETTN